MEWFPTVFIAFKVLVLITGMYFAIKWHYEKEKLVDRARMPSRRVSKVVALFVLSLVGLLLLTFVLSRKLGLDLTFP